MNFDEILKPIIIEGLQKTIDWYKSNNQNQYYLRSIFDQLGFKDRDKNDEAYYVPPVSLSSRLSCPKAGYTNDLEEVKKGVLLEIKDNYNGFSIDCLSTLNLNQLLFLLEKFGGNVPVDVSGKVSAFDAYKIKAARKVVKKNRESYGHYDNLLININISGIQRFIYNISSTGALKNLRSRSFFIELLSHHIIKKVLDAFNLHHVNILMNGGGNIYMLSSCPKNYKEVLSEKVSYNLNKWLLKEFNGRLHATFCMVECNDKRLDKDLHNVCNELSDETFKEKQRKFSSLVKEGDFIFVDENDPKYQGCEICYKDDAADDYHRVDKNLEHFRCSVCERLVKLGNDIPKIRFIYKNGQDSNESLKIEDAYYLLSKISRNDLECLWIVYDEEEENLIKSIDNTSIPIFAKTFTKTNRDLEDETYKELQEEKKQLQTRKNEVKEDAEEQQALKEEIDSLRDENSATLEYIAKCSEGDKLIGALRMDADNIGKLLHEGFGKDITLENISSLSRNINYFFKLHLSAICRYGFHFSDARDKGRNVHVIYAGGDDLFILGAWSDCTELAIDVSKAFRKYTCNNIDLGLSSGLTLHSPKVPVSKMADESMAALNISKSNLEPCWMCRKEWIRCPLYKTGEGKCQRKDSLTLFFTEYMASRKKRIDEENIKAKYSRAYSRLNLALKWESHNLIKGKLETVNEVEEYILKPLDSFIKGRNLGNRFFQNVLSMLSTWYSDGTLYMPRIVWMLDKFRRQLKREKVDKGNDKTLYDLYETYMHFYDTKRFSTLHIPLQWNIYLMKGENNNEAKTDGGKAHSRLGTENSGQHS